MISSKQSRMGPPSFPGTCSPWRRAHASAEPAPMHAICRFPYLASSGWESFGEWRGLRVWQARQGRQQNVHRGGVSLSVHTHSHIHTYTCAHTQMHVHTDSHACTLTCMHAHSLTGKPIHAHTHSHTCTLIRTHTLCSSLPGCVTFLISCIFCEQQPHQRKLIARKMEQINPDVVTLWSQCLAETWADSSVWHTSVGHANTHT